MVFRYKRLYGVIAITLGLLILLVLCIQNESEFTMTTNTQTSISLPIIMYHHMSEDEEKANKYTVLCSEFESDLQYLEQNGYTTVTMSEVIAYVEGEYELPEKPIVITFDDGFYSTLALAYPLLEQYQMCAVVSVIGSVAQTYSDSIDHNVNYANLNWEEIAFLDQTDEIEIQNHTYDLHEDGENSRKGLSRLNGETLQQYEQVITQDLTAMQERLLENCNIVATTIAYPYGAYSNETLDIIKSLGFKASFVCEERVNVITVGQSECLYNLGRYNRESGVSSEEFFASILT